MQESPSPRCISLRCPMRHRCSTQRWRPVRMSDEGAGEDAGEGLDAEEGADDERREHDEGAGRDHLLDGGVGGDLDAVGVVRLACALHQPGDGVELPPDLLHHLQRRAADALHRHGGEPVREHCSDDQSDDHLGGQDVDHLHPGSADEGAEQCKGHQCC
ncbi:Os02g0802575 [Oryza sativa Japonica Group]|uniref:Os02g0802575 protein n=1 Tax=Oryza sativa subsp. japonica TaxID=39947 RepID=A0A0P0VQS6_ORYSJ|nr:hypothetical protein EE612_014287 [Oryza sativa]BAS81428.1 Os02g0802575 [Oryza sativa Japonica Group]